MSPGDPLGGGSRLMLGFHGTEPDDALKRVLQETGARSVILFARNIESAAQCRRLIDGIRALVPWPLVIAVDQEGGAVVRVLEGATVFPGNMALGAADDPTLARDQGRASGRQLAAMGFDLNLAPVLDLQTNPANPGIGIRSLGARRSRAEALARELVLGHAESGVTSCLKHFPGMGAASVDAHLDLPVIAASREEFEEPHLAIFRTLCGAGLRAAVMTTHVLVEGLDPQWPATLSRSIVTGLLRGELGHDGLVLADDMEMGAIVEHYGVPGAVLQAARAGHDLVPICHTAAWQLEAAWRLDAALKSGELDMEEHRASLARIDASRRGALPEALASTAEGDEIAARIARAAVHRFGDPRGLLPLGASPLLVLSPLPHAVVGVEEDAHRDWRGLLHRLFAARQRDGLEVHVFAHESAAERVSELCERARAAARVVLCTWDLHACAPQRQLLTALAEAVPERLVVAHLRNPFDQALVPETITSLTPFGYRIVQLEALVMALFGHLPCAGILPAPICGRRGR